MKDGAMIEKLIRCRKAARRFQGLSWDATMEIAESFEVCQKEIDALVEALRTVRGLIQSVAPGFAIDKIDEALTKYREEKPNA